MKLRHRETGEIIDLPDYLPDYEDAKEIARVFHEASIASDENLTPPNIISLKTETSDIIHVSKITNTPSHFPYDKLIRIHLHLAPYNNMEQKQKSTIWSVLVNNMIWSLGDHVHGHVIQKLEWNPTSGWWALTDGIYAIHLEKIVSDSLPPDHEKEHCTPKNNINHNQIIKAGYPPVIKMKFQSVFRKMTAN